MKPRVTVVGLGPGDPSLLTVGTTEAIAGVSHRYLRTELHPSATAVPGGRSFDDVYRRHDRFSDVYASIVETLLADAGRLGHVLYAVPGSPAVAERTVELLLAQGPAAGVDIEIVPALSFADLAWVRLGIDPLADPVTLVDGHRFADDIAGRRGPFLVAQCHSNAVLSDIKLSLSEAVTDPSGLPLLTILHHLGLDDEQLVRVDWSSLDRTLDADHLTSVYVPELPGRVGVAADRIWTLMQRLRRECPWNAEQTPQSLAPYALEEARELVEAVSFLDPAADMTSRPADPAMQQAPIAHYAQELGDVLYQVLFHSVVAEDEGWFSLEDVITGLQAKLVHRHPHLFPRPDFDPGVITSSADVVRNWDLIKAMERTAGDTRGAAPGETGWSAGRRPRQ